MLLVLRRLHSRTENLSCLHVVLIFRSLGDNLKKPRVQWLIHSRGRDTHIVADTCIELGIVDFEIDILLLKRV